MSVPLGASGGRRIAILYDCAYPFVPGGGQKRLYEIGRRLVKRGWQVDWYAMKSWSGADAVISDGIRFIPVAQARSLYSADGKRSIWQAVVYGAAVAKFPRLGGYDFVHIGQWPYFHFFPTLLFSLFAKARISADWWETWGRLWFEYYGRKGGLGIILERLCAGIPKRLVAISERGANQLVELGIPSRRVRVIHNGIDWRRIQDAVPDRRSSGLIYLGRLQPHKNVDLLIRALALLRHRGAPLPLTIIGDGPQRDALEKLVAELGLRNQVAFLGAVASDDEVYGLLRGSRIFVHPSTKEGGGSITSLEANAAGLPVVAFRHPGGISPELIEEGLNGYWAGEISAASLADAIGRGLGDLEAKSHSRLCREFAARFDWDSIADQYERFFQEE